MPFLSTNQYGTGPLYQFGSNPGDNSAYLLAGVTFYQTSQAAANAYAIWMNLADSYLTVAGSIGSRSFGIRATGSGEADITVTSTGYVGGDIAAIQFDGSANARLVNDGSIVATTGASSAVSANEAAGKLSIVNTGTIVGGFAAMSLDDEDDDIVNTGTIVGYVYLGGGTNSIDTHLGSLTGPILGGAANDRYTIAGTEEIIENADGGHDRVTSYGDYRLASGLEDLTLMGAAHVGGGNALANFIAGTVEDCRLNGFGGNDYLIGNLGDDLLIGGIGNDRLDGGEGDNLLRGGDGDDILSMEGDGTNVLIGGDGDDELDSGAGSDSLRGGAGIDIVAYFASTAGIMVNLTTNAVSGGWATGDTLSAIENVYGSLFDDKLTGSSGNNHLYGLNGNDTLAGLDGDDRLEGGADADQIDGGVGSDTVEYALSAAAVTINLGIARGAGGDATGDRYTSIENAVGSAGADTINGSDGANVLRGGAGADTINGGKGADTLSGDAGDDILSGGADADVYAFADVVPGTPGWGDDLVTIFQNGIDKISFVGSSAVHSFADVFSVQDGGDTVISVAGNSIRLAGFDAGLLDASDFIFG